MSADEFEDLHNCLEQFYIDDHRYEKDTFFIFIDPSYKKTITNQDMKIRRKGYASDMMMVYGMCDGEVYPPVNGKFTAVLSEASKQESRFYLLAPLHEGDEVFGFIVFCDDVDKIIESNSLFRYVERLSLSLGKFHMSANLAISNQRLMEMTETDALTRVKNRTAYELAVAKYDHKIKNSTIDELGLAVFDINNLKMINDNLGHELGDEYIKNCCKLICTVFKHSPVFRIGGDEFVAIVFCGEDKLKEIAKMDENYEKLMFLQFPEGFDWIINHFLKIWRHCETDLNGNRIFTPRQIIDYCNCFGVKMTYHERLLVLKMKEWTVEAIAELKREKEKE